MNSCILLNNCVKIIFDCVICCQAIVMPIHSLYHRTASTFSFITPFQKERPAHSMVDSCSEPLHDLLKCNRIFSKVMYLPR